jgi:hypothetical protein
MSREATYLARVTAVEKAAYDLAANNDDLVVDIINDPSACASRVDDAFKLDPHRQPTPKEYAKYQAAERERVAREENHVTRVTIKRRRDEFS